MAQVCLRSAMITLAVGPAIQRSRDSLTTLSRELEINHKTAGKWRKPQTFHEDKSDLTSPRSKVPKKTGRATIVAFRRNIRRCLTALSWSQCPTAVHSALAEFSTTPLTVATWNLAPA